MILGSNKNRRSTCPEIWLNEEENDRRKVTKCFVKIYGSSTVGKKTIAKQLFCSADAASANQDSISIGKFLVKIEKNINLIRLNFVYKFAICFFIKICYLNKNYLLLIYCPPKNFRVEELYSVEYKI